MSGEQDKVYKKRFDSGDNNPGGDSGHNRRPSVSFFPGMERPVFTRKDSGSNHSRQNSDGSGHSRQNSDGSTNRSRRSSMLGQNLSPLTPLDGSKAQDSENPNISASRRSSNASIEGRSDSIHSRRSSSSSLLTSGVFGSFASSIDSRRSSVSRRSSDANEIPNIQELNLKETSKVKSPGLEGLYRNIEEAENFVPIIGGEKRTIYRHLRYKPDLIPEVRSSLQRAFAEHVTDHGREFRDNRDVLETMKNKDIPISELREVRNAIYNQTLSDSEVSEDSKNWKLMWCKVIDDVISRRYLDRLEDQVKKIKTQNVEKSIEQKEDSREAKKNAYTFAVIEINGKCRKVTKFQSSGGDKSLRSPFQYPEDDQIMKRKLIVTAKDSEVKTLAEVEKFLHGLSSSVQKDSVTPNDTIRITIYGNVATCDGCDYRIEEFMSACQNRIPYKELTVNSCYSGKPKEEEMQNVKGMDFKMKYGRDDAYKVETPTFSFHVQHYSDQMIAGKTFPKREYFGGVEEVDR